MPLWTLARWLAVAMAGGVLCVMAKTAIVSIWGMNSTSTATEVTAARPDLIFDMGTPVREENGEGDEQLRPIAGSPFESASVDLAESWPNAEIGSECGGGEKKPKDDSSLFGRKGPREAIPMVARHFDPAAALRDAGLLGGAEHSDRDLLGTRSTGFGAGPGTRVPTVRRHQAAVRGPLDERIIQRIVRTRIHEVRECYQQGLVRDRDARGCVTVQFTIGGAGKVLSAVVQQTTMSGAEVGDCIARKLKRWTFPRPRGGDDVHVTYPFGLQPG